MKMIQGWWQRFKRWTGIAPPDVFDKSKMKYTDGDNT